MTIAEKLYRTDIHMLKRIIIIYQLDELSRLYFPPNAEYSKLMMPSSYTGRVERRKGAVTQPHRQVIR